jgi:DNA (cytosine-5)-methyltransferase 1
MIPVIDVFAGPGGLGEGFSALRHSGNPPIFKIALSIEKDPIAYQTLRLRSFFRQFPNGPKPNEYYEQIRNGKIDWDLLTRKYPSESNRADQEVWQAQLGTSDYPPSAVDERIRRALNGAQVVREDVRIYTGLLASLLPGKGERVHDSAVVFSRGQYMYSGWSKR